MVNVSIRLPSLWQRVFKSQGKKFKSQRVAVLQGQYLCHCNDIIQHGAMEILACVRACVLVFCTIHFSGKSTDTSVGVYS